MALLLVMLFGALVYGDKSVDYSIDEVQMEALFELEQEVLENYEIASELGLENSISPVEGIQNSASVLEVATTEVLNDVKINKIKCSLNI